LGNWLGENLVSLTFKPQRAVYDRNKGVVRFFAQDGPVLVRCAVSKNALASLADTAASGEHLLERVFRRHRERIQEIASRKHQAQKHEADGSILVRRRDLAS